MTQRLNLTHCTNAFFLQCTQGGDVIEELKKYRIYPIKCPGAYFFKNPFAWALIREGRQFERDAYFLRFLKVPFFPTHTSKNGQFGDVFERKLRDKCNTLELSASDKIHSVLEW